MNAAVAAKAAALFADVLAACKRLAPGTWVIRARRCQSMPASAVRAIRIAGGRFETVEHAFSDTELYYTRATADVLAARVVREFRRAYGEADLSELLEAA